MSGLISQYRRKYHQDIGKQILRWSRKNKTSFPNFADGSSPISVAIGNKLCSLLGFKPAQGRLTGQEVGRLFESITCEFLRKACSLLDHLRPGNWVYSVQQTQITNFVQYRHLTAIQKCFQADQELLAAMGHGYIITPDIIIARRPVCDQQINQRQPVVTPREPVARYTRFRQANHDPDDISWHLHASISCKWTIRSDRSQNTRTEALNLIRYRKGTTPHIVAVVAEVLPTRIASLALGTGDLDCVYHIALPELHKACESVDSRGDQLEMLDLMIQGERLRDISDLPFDLAV